MSRYIDADKLKVRLEDFSKWCKDGRKQGVDFVLDCQLPDTPGIDVVPRSEVEKWKEINEQLHKEMSERIIEERKIERKLAKQEVARELIAEFKTLAVNYVKDRDLLLVAFKNALAYAETELEKKYAGELICPQKI